MDFYAILDQVIDLLRSRGRVSYRALQRQFGLAEDYVEDLKVELIEVQELATDRDNKMLVWIGETESISASIPQPAQTSDQPETQQDQSIQTEPLSSESPTPNAERRQLTVMFCDLADSTRLSGQLDPEDLRDVIRAYQSTSAEVIEHYDGYIAQHLGDGLMVYFGWPQAHEDDAQRAVHVSLGILEAVQGLNTRLEQEKGIYLAVRIGIHTGLVVVGEIGQGARQEHLALGETPNVASRIEGIAEPDTVAISEVTHRLIQGYFDCNDLGAHMLRGVEAPMQVYRVVRQSGMQSRFEVMVSRGLTPLVGREDEIALLSRRWEQSRNGQGQVVLLSGEGGIGKSRLVEAIREQVESEGCSRLALRCSPYHTNSALYPVIEHLQRWLQLQRDDTPETKLDKLEQVLQAQGCVLAEVLPLFAALLGVPLLERYAPLNLTPQRQRQQTLEALVSSLLAEAGQRPFLMVWEDLHWADPSTLELLTLLIARVPTAPLLNLMTFRPEFHPSWSMASHFTYLALNRFTPEQIEQMAAYVAGGKTLPTEVIKQLVIQTDGVPLFVEEMTKTAVESNMLVEYDEHYELTGSFSSLGITTTLHDTLMARLDRLGTAKGIAQLGSVIGRQFSYDLLRAVSHIEDTTLQQELGRLVDAELVYQRGLAPQATYHFKHALVVEAAYQALLKSTRQQYHQRIGTTLETRFPEMVERQPELLAHHYTEAGLNEQAVSYWFQAGENAKEQVAHTEAISHLKKGLQVLRTLPETPMRAQQELTLCFGLGTSLMSARGLADPDVGQVYARARILCQQLEEPLLHFRVLRGLWTYHLYRGELRRAHEIVEDLYRVIQCQTDPGLHPWGHFCLGVTLLSLGDLVQGRRHLEQSLLPGGEQQEAPSYGAPTNPAVMRRMRLAAVLWTLGFPDQAVKQNRKAISIAEKVSHPFNTARAFCEAAKLYWCFKALRTTHEYAKSVVTLSQEHDFTQCLAEGRIYLGWAMVMRRETGEGIRLIVQGLDVLRQTGIQYNLAHYLALLAEVYRQVAQPEEGLAAQAEALALVEKTGECWWEAELYRIKGELLLAASPGNQTEAEICFNQAIKIAQSQQAKSWELRAATRLARLWQSQGKCQEAYDLLTPVHGWFTEGFDTADLKDARTLLEALSRELALDGKTGLGPPVT